MTSPLKYKSGSPIRALEDKFSTRRLGTILEQERSYIKTQNLATQNEILTHQNEKLYSQYSRVKNSEAFHLTENSKLIRQIELLEDELKEVTTKLSKTIDLKNKEIESLERDQRLIRNQLEKEVVQLRDEITNLINKNVILERRNVEDIEGVKRKYITANIEENNYTKRYLEDDIKKVLNQLETARFLLSEKEQEVSHLTFVNNQSSADYSFNLETLISENNIMRNKLSQVELEKNKEIHQVQNKKELQKSRTIGILSYCKENNFFIEKQLTRLAEQLLQKNISIESFTRELLKQRKAFEDHEKKYEATLNKLKISHSEQISEKENSFSKMQKFYKDEIADQKTNEYTLQEQLSTLENNLDATQRELAYSKEQIHLKEKQISDLKDMVKMMNEDHSKELSKVMLDSRVKRKSGLNFSSYSSSSLKDIEEAQGSSIIKSGRLQRQLSIGNYNEEGGHLPVVKEELAASQGHIDEEEDIEVKQLILHYESMIEEIKKNKILELEIANQKIENLKLNLTQKQQQILDILNRFSPLMELKVNSKSLEEERKEKILQNYKADIDILSVMLDKYRIVALNSSRK